MLHNSVAMHIIVQRVKVGEILWRPALPTMVQRMHADIILFDQSCLQLLWQLFKRRSRVRELSITTSIRWWQDRSTEKRIAGSPWVE